MRIQMFFFCKLNVVEILDSFVHLAHLSGTNFSMIRATHYLQSLLTYLLTYFEFKHTNYNSKNLKKKKKKSNLGSIKTLDFGFLLFYTKLPHNPTEHLLPIVPSPITFQSLF